MSETWVINSTVYFMGTAFSTNINFTSNGINYSLFNARLASKPTLEGYLYYDTDLIGYYDAAGDNYFYNNGITTPVTDENWLCKTVTFETSPTGDLLTWLTVNAVKQSTQAKTLKINSSVVHHVNGQYPLTFNTASISGGYAPSYNITATCTNVTASASNPTTIPKFGSVTLTFTADGTNYKVPTTYDISTIVGATGTFSRISDTECRITLSNPTGNVGFSIEGESVELTELCFTANTAGSTIELIKIGSPSIANTAYSTDRQTWTTFTPSTTAGTNTITLTNVGDKVYFRNDITANLTANDYMKFVMSGSIAASGNVNSVYDADGFNNLTTLTYIYCYYYMFAGCTSLTTAPSLPATTLASYCYSGMFYGCTSLTTAPSLPATTLASYCYQYMFDDCTSLYVSDTQTSEATYTWTIPTSGTFTNTTTYNQTNMFSNCLGTRSSNDMSGAYGESHTYYTQNAPV